MFEPGSARHGNFINYYTFNPPEKRLKLLPKTLLNDDLKLEKDSKKFALDVGCNSGELTYGLLDHFKDENLKILGIDLDSMLIQRSLEGSPDKDQLDFKVVDITSSEHRSNIINEYLFANNVRKFHVTFLFSVTMWVHLLHGDAGLEDLLRYCSSVSKFVLIEPQSWKSYKSAVRRAKRLNKEPFQEFDRLVWRDDVAQRICDFLASADCSMELVRHFGQTEWERDLYLFKHID